MGVHVKNWEAPVIVTITVALSFWALSKPGPTSAEVCAEYYRISTAPADPAALVELAKDAPPGMVEDLLVLAGLSPEGVTPQRASSNIAAAC